jgi:hypothetical protein
MLIGLQSVAFSLVLKFRACTINNPALTVLYMISMVVVSEGILTFRTWAVWRLDKKTGIIMGSVFVLSTATSVTFGTLSMLGLECTSSLSWSAKALNILC